MLQLGKENMGAGGGKTHISDTNLGLSKYVLAISNELSPRHENMKYIPPNLGRECSRVERWTARSPLADATHHVGASAFTYSLCTCNGAMPPCGPGVNDQYEGTSCLEIYLRAEQYISWIVSRTDASLLDLPV